MQQPFLPEPISYHLDRCHRLTWYPANQMRYLRGPSICDQTASSKYQNCMYTMTWPCVYIGRQWSNNFLCHGLKQWVDFITKWILSHHIRYCPTLGNFVHLSWLQCTLNCIAHMYSKCNFISQCYKCLGFSYHESLILCIINLTVNKYSWNQ